jgi:hypothetical protein
MTGTILCKSPEPTSGKSRPISRINTNWLLTKTNMQRVPIARSRL